MLKRILRYIGNSALCGFILLMLFLWGFVSALDRICRIPAVERFREASCQDYSEKVANVFYPGDKVSVDGQAGVVNRECWMTVNNYAVRLANGTITFVRGENLTRRN